MQKNNTPLRHQDNGLSTSELARNLGRKLRYLRAQSGLTQAELSTRTAMGRAYLSKIENGKILPHYLTLVRLATCFGVSPAELVRVEVRTDSNGSKEPKQAHL